MYTSLCCLQATIKILHQI